MDQELKQQLDRMEAFLMNHMVTKEEFSQLGQKVDKIEQSVNQLTQSVERLATLVQKMMDEHTAIKHQMLAMQDWIRKAAEKIGVEFKL